MRTVRWNHTSRKLFLFIISLLMIIPAVSVCAIKTDALSILTRDPNNPALSIFSAFNVNNTTKGGSGIIAPLSPNSGDDPSTSENPDLNSVSDTTDDGKTSSSIQTDEPPTVVSIEVKMQVYGEALAANAIAVKPMLSLKCPDGVAAGSMFKVVVTSADVPIEKATVSFINQKVLTDEKGAAYLQAPQVSEEMKIPITASKGGYENYTTYVHIIPTPAEMISDVSAAGQIAGSSSSQNNYPSLFSTPQSFFQNLFRDSVS
jgi:hypothetical protein